MKKTKKKQKTLKSKKPRHTNTNRKPKPQSTLRFDIDNHVDNETWLHRVYTKVSHAEMIIDCMIGLGDTLSHQDIAIQLIELADILDDAQSNLLQSDYGNSWETIDCNELLSGADEADIEAFEEEFAIWTSQTDKAKLS